MPSPGVYIWRFPRFMSAPSACTSSSKLSVTIPVPSFMAADAIRGAVVSAVTLALGTDRSPSPTAGSASEPVSDLKALVPINISRLPDMPRTASFWAGVSPISTAAVLVTTDALVSSVSVGELSASRTVILGSVSASLVLTPTSTLKLSVSLPA